MPLVAALELLNSVWTFADGRVWAGVLFGFTTISFTFLSFLYWRPAVVDQRGIRPLLNTSFIPWSKIADVEVSRTDPGYLQVRKCGNRVSPIGFPADQLGAIQEIRARSLQA